MSQSELEQTAEPLPAVRGPGHLLLSLPQLFTSEIMLMQSVLAEFSARPLLHVMPQVELEHVAEPVLAVKGPAHLLLALPQLLTSDAVLTQSVPAAFSTKPGLHARSHAEFAQTAEPVPAVRGPAHLLLSFPQLLTSMTVLTFGAQSVFAALRV